MSLSCPELSVEERNKRAGTGRGGKFRICCRDAINGGHSASSENLEESLFNSMHPKTVTTDLADK